MKWKKIIAVVMTFVFSLSLVQINVNAEENIEKVNTESVVVIEKEENKKEPTEKTTECSTAKKIVTEVAEVFLSVIVFVASKTINGFKLLLYLFKYMCQ